MAGREIPQPVIEVRPLTRLPEYAEAVRLQKLVWGFGEIDLLPVRVFVTATNAGGHAFGAYDGDRMIGFCLAIPGIKPGAKGYLHSHMLGVLKEYRDAGAGRLLKLEQRKDALARGVDLIEWTFDPLEIKNAYFNVERLGAIVRRFVLNQYGITSSRLQGGLPTDRCIAEWWIASARVEAILSGRGSQSSPAAARISVPADMDVIKKSDPPRAREIQTRVSDQFLEHFSKGLAVTGFARSTGTGDYILTPWESK